MCPRWPGSHEELFCSLARFLPCSQPMGLLEAGSQEAQHQMAGVSKMESLVQAPALSQGTWAYKVPLTEKRGASWALGTFARPLSHGEAKGRDAAPPACCS